MLLHFKGFLISFKTSFAITLIGSFWTVVLPGLAGGDVVKAGYLFVNVSERRADAISVVLIDRILGVFSLFLLGAMAASAAWAFGYVLVDSMVLIISPAAVISLTMVAFLVSGRWFSNLRIVKAGYSGLPGKVGNLVSSLRDYLRCPKLMLLAIVVSIANHALVLTTFIVAGLLIGDGIAVAMHYILDPLAMTMNMVPLTPGGVGIAEGAFSVLYKMVGSADGAAVGLLGRFIQYAVFVISGSVALCLLRVRFRIPALKKHEVTGIGSEGTRIP
jgi:hypothetical protein